MVGTIQAYDASGNLSGPGEMLQVDVPAPPDPLPAPGQLVTSVVGGVLVLDWSGNPLAAGYTVFIERGLGVGRARSPFA